MNHINVLCPFCATPPIYAQDFFCVCIDKNSYFTNHIRKLDHENGVSTKLSTPFLKGDACGDRFFCVSSLV